MLDPILHLFFLLFLAITIGPLVAQAPLWSAEVEVDVITEAHPIEPYYRVVLKRSPISEAFGMADEFSYDHLGAKVYEAIWEGRKLSYWDRDFSQPVSQKELGSLFVEQDTIMNCYPGPGEPAIFLVESERSPESFEKIRLHIRLSYFVDGSLTQAIRSGSFIINRYDDNGNEILEGPRIFFPVTTYKEPLNFQLPRWNMIDQYRLNLFIQEITILENNTISTDSLLQHLITAALNADDGNFRTTDGFYGPLSEEDRFLINGELMYEHPIPDPVTLEPIIETKAAPFDPSSIEKVRLLQYWAWDAAKAELVILPIGYAPLKSVYDEVGNHLYDLPLFYWIPERFRE